MAKEIEVYDFGAQKVDLVPQDMPGSEMSRINFEGKYIWRTATS